MAKGRSGQRDRGPNEPGKGHRRRRRRTLKPVGWPRYMIAKELRAGTVAYYWNVPKRDLQAGCLLHRESLGTDYSAAIQRADMLNAHLDAWRGGRTGTPSPEHHTSYGTVDWWFDTYLRSPAFAKLADRTKPGYRHQLNLFADMTTRKGQRLGELPARAITAAAVDKIYTRLLEGTDGQVHTRRANHTIDIAKKAWTVVQRTHPHQFLVSNPFIGLTRFRTTTAIKHATRAEAYALSDAIKAYGHPDLALVPLICFEWLQRPENILSGHLRWTDYRPTERPQHVRIFHHKTGEEVWHPLEGDGEVYYPELEARLKDLARRAIPIVVTPAKKGAARPYSFSYAKRIVREARRAAGLPEHVTMTACRHGGMTELGDAELTEQGVMSLSGHRTPDAARGYIKKTDTQRLAAVRRRRAWVEKLEHTEYASQNEHWLGESESRS